MDKIYYELDTNTGELCPVECPIVELNPGDRIIRKRQMDVIVEKNAERQFKEQFVWVLFTYGEKLLPNISSANLTRLMYVATFCEPDGSLMKKAELKEKTGLNRARWSEFWNEMTANNILYENDGVVCVNPELFSKGKISTSSNYTRLFCEYVRNLYEACDDTKQHKQLSYVFKIMPFVNRRTNFICFNPQEQDTSKIKYMSVGDFCDAIGYEKSHARRLVKDLLSIRLNGERIIGFFVTDLNEETWALIVNPKLYFGGRRSGGMFDEKRKLFELETEKNQNTTQN